MGCLELFLGAAVEMDGVVVGQDAMRGARLLGGTPPWSSGGSGTWARRPVHARVCVCVCS